MIGAIISRPANSFQIWETINLLLLCYSLITTFVTTWPYYALLQANVLYIVLAFLLVSWLTDLAYGWIDPRLSYERE